MLLNLFECLLVFTPGEVLVSLNDKRKPLREYFAEVVYGLKSTFFSWPSPQLITHEDFIAKSAIYDILTITFPSNVNLSEKREYPTTIGMSLIF